MSAANRPANNRRRWGMSDQPTPGEEWSAAYPIPNTRIRFSTSSASNLTHGAFVADTVDHGFDNHPEHLEITPLLMTQYQQASETLMEAMDPQRMRRC